MQFPKINAATGATGPTGATGADGSTITATTAFAANTTGASISLNLGGATIALPDEQILPAGITSSAGDTIFTVENAGRYRISYYVNTTLSLIMGTRLMINGSSNPQSTIAALLSLSSYANEILIDLAANSTISLQLVGAVGLTASLPANALGASLMIMRLS